MSDPWKANEPIKEENIINESERDSANPENDEYKLVKLEDDGRFSVEFLRNSITRIYDETSSPYTWTKPENLVAIEVEIIGGGGGGGGINLGGRAGGNGGGGGYAFGRFLASELGATETITIGDGGNGSVGNGAGSAGGTSSFGSLLTANGGGAGGASVILNPTSQPTHGSGGTSSGGIINVRGTDGKFWIVPTSTETNSRYNQGGGDSFLGKGGPQYEISGTSGVSGGNGSGKGAGGAGGANANTSTTRDGGNGMPGFCRIIEYYS